MLFPEYYKKKKIVIIPIALNKQLSTKVCIRDESTARMSDGIIS